MSNATLKAIHSAPGILGETPVKEMLATYAYPA